jgi:hypothetical protein
VTWLAIVVMALGLPLGMLIERVRERRAAERKLAADMRADRQDIENARRWRAAQDSIDDMLHEAAASAQNEIRRRYLEQAQRCGCASCKAAIAAATRGTN